MNFKIALIEGDGIGPEQTAVTRGVLAEVQSAFGISLSYVEVEAGDRALLFLAVSTGSGLEGRPKRTEGAQTQRCRGTERKRVRR